MKYVKPEIEVINVKDNIFMAVSGNTPDYSTASSALSYACGGYNGGDTNNFQCTDFGGYNASNPPPQNIQVTIGNEQYTYVYDYKGNHWKLHKGKN